MNWYFPESIDEVRGLLDRGQVHGGGTQILKMNRGRIKGLIDLGRLDLKYTRNVGGIIRLGAAQTYNGIVQYMRDIDPDHILVKALQKSSSESLRNRITLGGSVVGFPVWSDIMGPLLALDAAVTLVGKNEGDHPVREFIENRKLREQSFITELSFPLESWISSYYRETRTQFDHALFTVTILLRKTENRVDDCRIIVIGTKKRFTCLDLAEALRNKPVDGLEPGEIVRSLGINFPSRRSLPSEYIVHLARVQIERGLDEVLRR
jgi:CO/xanthine dehydrogenase FAD-binding subunit